MQIGQKIRQRRTELGWTQRELASRMGYTHHSTLARIETGQVDVSQKRIEQFSKVLDISIAELMGWEEEKPVETDELSENAKKLIEFVKTVPEDKAELVLRVLRSIVESD